MPPASARKPSKRKKAKPGRRHMPLTRHPAKSLAEIVLDKRCTARTKVCSKCGVRYVKGDKRQECPGCGSPRRCKNKAVEGTTICRLHGYHPAAVQTKFLVARQIESAYNRLIGNPDLLNLSYEIAAVTARTDELMHMLDSHDARAAGPDIAFALGTLENVLADALGQSSGRGPLTIPRDDLRSAVMLLRQAVEPVNIERHVWDMLSANFELTRRLNSTERQWLLSNEGMIPVVQVLEMVIALQRMTLKYIRDTEDRAAFANEVRREIPIEVIARG